VRIVAAVLKTTLFISLVAWLAGCGGGGGGGGAPVLPATYTIGGTVSGLATGNTVVLQNNGGDSWTVFADGAFQFGTPVADGTSYDVTILVQPFGQTCTVANGTGTISGADITSIAVNCVTNTYTVSSIVSGLAAGNSVVLQNNSGDNLTVNTDGTHAFATALVSGDTYAVTVLTQPTTPNQVCTVSNGSGTIINFDITVTVSCVTTTYTIGGTVSGLATGNTVVLQNNGGDSWTVFADGAFQFGTPVADGTSYDVTILVQPFGQTCTVANGTGTISGADITSIAVNCVTNTYTVSSIVSGLAAGNSVVLQNNSGDNLTVNTDGTHAFATALVSGDTYAVTVLTQPTTPNQVCTVSNGSGTIINFDITVTVSCVTTTYTIGGTVSGLATGNTVVLENNGVVAVTVSANGAFQFAAAVPDGSAYDVTVLTQPTTPNQACAVTNGTGTISGADVTDITITCITTTYMIGGTVSGLATGNNVVLQNNGGDDLTVAANGNFTLPTAVTDGGSYNVTVLTQPTAPNQTCTVTNGSGTVSGSNVTNVAVACVNNFTLGGAITGLEPGNRVILQNNAGDDLTVSANGAFTFATDIADGSTFDVSVLTQPAWPKQSCAIANGTGTISNSNITNVTVVCVITRDHLAGIFHNPMAGTYASTSLTFGDVDGDGNPDLIESRLGQADAVLLNDGRGSYIDSGQSLSADNTLDIELGDVDGDGDLDMAVAINGLPNRVYFNDGTGTFTDSGQALGVIHGTQDVILADVDSDGDLDLLTANNGQANRVYFNDGTGTFTDSGQALGSNNTYAIVVGDIDGDGDLDLVSANFNNQGNRVYINDGTGTFTDSGQSLGTNNTTAVSLGDVDSDGDLDLVTGNSTLTNRLYINDGTGTFTDSGQSLGSNNSRSVVLADLDADGDLDLTEGNWGQANRIYFNDGAGNFTDSGQALGANDTFSAIVVDIDGDGDLDVVSADYNQANQVFINNGNGFFTDGSQAMGTSETYSVSLGDVDGDGDLDFVTGNWNQANGVYLNDGLGNFSLGASLGSNQTHAIALADLDFNGTLDLVEGNWLQGNRVLLGDGSGGFFDNGQSLGTSKTFDIALGDVDGDGDPDLVTGNDGQANLVWINDGQGNFTDSGQTLGTNATASVTLGDVDGDLDLDLVTGNLGQANRVYLNDGTGTFTDSGQALGASTTYSVELGDLDSDGDLDLVAGNSSGEANRIYLNDGTGTFTDSGQALGANSTLTVSLGDVDGDGDLDIVAGNRFSANRVYLNDGSGNFTDSGQALGVSATYATGLGDLDGDGDLDLLEGNSGAQPNRIYINLTN